MKKNRILTGDRTTGPLHLGHLVGSLLNRVRLQDEYETFILLADVQALTTHYQNPGQMKESIYQVALDNLAAGLEPGKITLIQQSRVPAIAELTMLYSMLVSVNVLRHNPTVKTEAKQYGYGELTYGFLGYPVSQTADITFCGADLVPVGDDQLPHMELARKLARRFNELYAGGEELIRVPQALLSETPRLPGLDGNCKMGKSLCNAVYLSDDADAVSRKIHSAVTDTNRIAVRDRGNPDVCTVYAYHRAFNAGERADICEMCRGAQIGCVACKKRLAERLNALLEPMRERRAYYERRRDEVRGFILEGSEKAACIGNETMARVRAAMRLEI